MTSRPDDPTDKEAKAEGRNALIEARAQSGREATADYRAREAAGDDNVDRLRGLRLARDAEVAADAAKAPASVPKARRAKPSEAPDEGHPDQLTTGNDG